MFLAMVLQRHFISLTTEKCLVEITLLLHSQNSFSQSCNWLGVCQIQFWKVQKFSLLACLKGFLKFIL